MSNYQHLFLPNATTIQEALKQAVLKYNPDFEPKELDEGLQLLDFKKFKGKETPLIAGAVHC